MLAMLLLVLAGLLMAMSVNANETEMSIVLRSRIEPEQGVWRGQATRLTIDVLGRDGWAQIPRFPGIDVPGALAIRYESQGARLQEQISGESYTGQRYTWYLFPQRDGRLTVPAVPVEVEIKQWGAGQSSVKLQRQTPPVSIEVKAPPGSKGVHSLVSTPSLDARQGWEPDNGPFRAGDAITRTIELSAVDISGLAFDPLSVPPLANVSIYQDEPVVKDKFERGSLTGHRRESITYVFSAPGKVALPDIPIRWWDPSSEKMRETVLPGRQLEVAAAADVESSTSSITRNPYRRAGWIGLSVLLLLGAAGWLMRNRLGAAWRQWRAARREREKVYFRAVLQAARGGDPVQTMNYLYKWLDRVQENDGIVRLDIFFGRFGDDRAQEQLHELLRLAGKGKVQAWDGKSFGKSMTEMRRNWLASRRIHARSRQTTVPPLNPGQQSFESNR